MSETTRTEYRFAYDAREGGRVETFERPLNDLTSLEEAESRLEIAARTPGTFNYRIQRRTVTETDWEDIADA